MAEILLQADRLCAAYGKAQVVSDVSLYMEKGEILALVGESGCGKSSVSLALTRLLPPSMYYVLQENGSWQREWVFSFQLHRGGAAYTENQVRVDAQTGEILELEASDEVGNG